MDGKNSVLDKNKSSSTDEVYTSSVAAAATTTPPKAAAEEVGKLHVRIQAKDIFGHDNPLGFLFQFFSNVFVL